MHPSRDIRNGNSSHVSSGARVKLLREHAGSQLHFDDTMVHLPESSSHNGRDINAGRRSCQALDAARARPGQHLHSESTAIARRLRTAVLLGTGLGQLAACAVGTGPDGRDAQLESSSRGPSELGTWTVTTLPTITGSDNGTDAVATATTSGSWTTGASDAGDWSSTSATTGAGENSSGESFTSTSTSSGASEDSETTGDPSTTGTSSTSDGEDEGSEQETSADASSSGQDQDGSGETETGDATDGTTDETAGDTTDGSSDTSTGDPECNLEALMTEADFEELFPHRFDHACEGTFYTWASLRDAAQKFPRFACEGDEDQRRRELAAFLAQISHETTGGWSTAPDGPDHWGLCFVEEVRCKSTPCREYCDASSVAYPCVAGRYYHGRGPIQLSWNYNYGQAGEALEVDLLAEPELLANDPKLSFASALWFWMTAQPPKPSAHDVMIGRWIPSAEDEMAGRAPGFGMTTNIIHGLGECGIPITDPVKDRIGFYERYVDFFATTAGPNVECSSMQPYTDR